MSLKQYMIVDEKGKRCLLLRFLNELNSDINAMEFRLVQLNSAGEVLDSSHVTVPDMRARAKNTYSLKKGIVLKEHCVDFRVTVLWVMSQGYKYVLRHSQMIPEYDVRGVENFKRPKQSVRSSVRRVGNPGHAAVALFSFMLVLVAAALFVYYSVRNFGNFSALRDFTENLF